MLSAIKRGAVLTTALLAATTATAQLSSPGSVLVFPAHHSNFFGAGAFTLTCVTNTDTSDATNLEYSYVNVIPDPSNPLEPLDCQILNRVEALTAADTFCVFSACHNAANSSGYVVVSAQDPQLFLTNWSFNSLVGSELVVTTLGSTYSVNAIPFKAIESGLTDHDGDGQIDFDGIEYERIPDRLYIDSFLATPGSSLTLINLTGGTKYSASVRFTSFNDNEQIFSATTSLKCWFERELTNISLIFSEAFLVLNTLNDSSELDVNCDGIDDLELGWSIIDGIVANSPLESQLNPALLGAINTGTLSGIDGGHLLWGGEELQGNGDFLKFAVDDFEFPCSASLAFGKISIKKTEGGVVLAKGSLLNTGSSPVFGIEIEAFVPVTESSGLDLGTVGGPFDLGGGASREISFQFIPPASAFVLKLTAKGVADVSCSLGQIVAKKSEPLFGNGAVVGRVR